MDTTKRDALITIAIILALLLGGLRLWDNWNARQSPPIACQLLGGHWNLWDGWKCY